MEKYIYMPTNYDAGMERYCPEVIYVDFRSTVDGKTEFRGNTSEKELIKGRFRFYSAHRCVPYTDELWKSCIEFGVQQSQFEAKQDEFEAKMLRLAKKAGNK